MEARANIFSQCTTACIIMLLAASNLQAQTITAEAILMAVPNQEALTLAAKSEVGGVSGVSLSELQKLATDDKARSEGTVSVTSVSGNRASARDGGIRLDLDLASRGGRISGPLTLHRGGASISNTISAKSGDLIYLGSFTGEGQTCMAFLRLTLSDGGKDSAK